MKYKVIFLILLGLFVFSSNTFAQTTAKLHYTVFTTLSKKGCYTAIDYKTFMMPDKVDYDIKTKIVDKKKAVLKTDGIKVNAKSFVLNNTDWVVVVEINYGELSCGSFKSIKSFKVSNESEIESKIQSYIKNSVISAPHIGYQILLKEQPNKTEETPLFNKIQKKALDFSPNEEKKEIKNKSTAIGVRG